MPVPRTASSTRLMIVTEPHPITVAYPGTCVICDEVIAVGNRAVYWPVALEYRGKAGTARRGRLYCGECGGMVLDEYEAAMRPSRPSDRTTGASPAIVDRQTLPSGSDGLSVTSRLP